jgi:hypothetical protein
MNIPAALLSLPCFFAGTVTAFRRASYGTILFQIKKIAEILNGK